MTRAQVVSDIDYQINNSPETHSTQILESELLTITQMLYPGDAQTYINN